MKSTETFYPEMEQSASKATEIIVETTKELTNED